MVVSLVQPGSITYSTGDYNTGSQYPLFPYVFEFYGYSLSILFLGFILALVIAVTLIMITFQLSVKKRTALMKLSTILEAVPDLFVIAMAQLFIIFLFKQTGILFFDVVGAYERPFILPLITYTILPTIFLYRTLTLLFDEELRKPYVELAKGKGLTDFRVLFVHVFRNGLMGLLYHSKMILAFMLSNLIMLEIIFNTRGITWFVYHHPTPEIATVSILLLAIPILLFEQGMNKLKSSIVGGEGQ